MKSTAVKARWAAKLMQSKSFIVITDTESVIFSEKTQAGSFTDYITAHRQLTSLAKFQAVINKTVRDFEKGISKKFTNDKNQKRGRKINVKVAK